MVNNGHEEIVLKDNVEPLKIQVKYFCPDLEEIGHIGGVTTSDWIDLRAAEDVYLEAGESKMIPLGIGMILPEGYEAWMIPRSSTPIRYGVLQMNGMAIFDESYCGNDDQWFFLAHALRKTEIHKNDRICQFRIVAHQPRVEIIRVEKLKDKSRGGVGSTGVK